VGEKELFGFSHEEAEKIFEDLKRFKTGTIEEVKREIKRVYPPPLHSLTSLQREANQKFRFSAKKTLDIAQKLYEDWKVISYPRTESRYLAESNRPLVVQILKKLGREDLIPEVGKVEKRVFDDSKLTDHHAIIPLEPPPPNLPPEERKIYDLILRRFLAVFYPPYVYERVLLLTRVGKKYHFLTMLKRVISPGWRVLYGKTDKGEEIPPFQKGERVKKVDQKMEKKQTQPPPRYTEGSLLKEMEKLGLGTPATRAQIIETLKRRGYVTLKGKSLIPTEKGRELVEKLSLSEVSSPEMTAQWEKMLEEINLRGLGYRGYLHFLEKIKDFTAKEVERVKGLTFEVKENSQNSKGKRSKRRYTRKGRFKKRS